VDILAKDDLASRAINLADPARAVALMPTLLEAEHVDVEPKARFTSATKSTGRAYHRCVICSLTAVLVMPVPDPPN